MRTGREEGENEKKRELRKEEEEGVTARQREEGRILFVERDHF